MSSIPAFRHLCLIMAPFLATSVAQETIELPANLNPALRQRLLAQNTVPQPTTGPADKSAAPAAAPAAPAAPATPATPATPPRRPAVTLPTPAAVPATPAATPGTPAAVVPPATPSRLPVPPTATPPTAPPGGPNARIPGAPGRPIIPGTPPGGVVPGPPAERAAPPEDSSDFTLAFAGNPIEEVLEEYQRISGRHVIRDLGLTGTVVVVQNADVKMSAAEGMDFIKASLLIQGFSLQEYIPENKEKGRAGVDKCIAITIKPPGLEGIITGSPIYMSAEELPESDVPVNYLIRLNYLSAADASMVFANAIPNHTWGAYTALPSANAILVRGAVPNIRSLIRIKDAVDIEPVPQVHEFVELIRASAEDVQAILDGILQAQTQASSASGVSTGFRPVAPQNAAPGMAGNPNVPMPQVAGAGTSSGVMPDGKSVIVKADPRTNRIFINGPKVHVDYLKKLVMEFDKESKVKNILTRQLRYIPVDDFIDIAGSSLAASGLGEIGGGGGGGGAAAAGGGSTRGSTAGQNQFGGGGSTRGSTSQFGGGGSTRGSQTQFGGGGGGGFGGGGGGGGGGGLGSRQSTAALPRSVTVGKTLLISDPRMNTLLVTGPPESMERISALIVEMDKRPLQVHINAVIAQITLGDDITTGIDLLRRVEDVQIAGQNVSLAGLYSSTGGRTFLDPANLDSVSGFTSAADGLNLYATVGELFNAYVSALEKTSRFKVLSKPHVATANNEIADIRVGTRVPIPSNQQSSIVGNGTTSVTSNVEYEDVELVLEVRPLINSKNEITIEVNQVNNTVAGSTLISGNQIPNILTQSLNNKITVPNGAIFTIGGSQTETRDNSTTGLPILSRIPVIKHLFGTNISKSKRQELIIMIQPRIIDTPDDMIDVHTSEVQRTVIGPEAESFAKPDRDTSDVILPSYEKDIPFDAAGYPNNQRPVGRSVFKRLGDALRGRYSNSLSN